MEYLAWKGWTDDREFAEDFLYFVYALEDVYIPHELARLKAAAKTANRTRGQANGKHA